MVDSRTVSEAETRAVPGLSQHAQIEAPSPAIFLKRVIAIGGGRAENQELWNRARQLDFEILQRNTATDGEPIAYAIGNVRIDVSGDRGGFGVDVTGSPGGGGINGGGGRDTPPGSGLQFVCQVEHPV